MKEQRRLASQIQFARLLQTFLFEQDSSLKIRSKRLVLRLDDKAHWQIVVQTQSSEITVA
jgi:hypothetical protein